MSLLLEALKKAEKAKQEAQRNAEAAAAPGGGQPDAFSLSPSEPRRVLTRDELPDISRSLDITSNDLSLSQAQPVQESRPAAAAEAPPEQPEPQASQRAAAKKVFEAKYREPNPKLPFYITMALLGMACVGTAGYFWYQLRPPPPLVNPNPPQRPGEAVPPPPPAGDAPAQSAPASAGEAPPPAIPGLPQTPPAQATAAQPSPGAGAPAVAASATAPSSSAAAKGPAVAGPVAAGDKAATPPASQPTGAAAKAAPRPPRASPAAPRQAAPTAQPPAESGGLTFTSPVPAVHPQVQNGYAAYLRGDLAAARDAYLAAIKEEPGNRDALLGLAAIETSVQRFDLAESYYQRLLQADPRDAHAQASLIALRGSAIDPLAAESRVKSLLASDPNAAVLNFSLGNQLAQQARWPEAQQAYFRAYAADPDNPDVAYNLAVSLDHLRQPALALQYYRRALALAEKHPAGFSAFAVRNRISDLER